MLISALVFYLRSEAKPAYEYYLRFVNMTLFFALEKNNSTITTLFAGFKPH